MNLAEFMKAANSTRMLQRTKDAARLVLVDGLKIVEAAGQYGMKPQQVHEAIARLNAAHKAAMGLPADWECVTVTVPRSDVEAVRDIERNALRHAGLLVD